jgi:hypothetical protein
MTLQTLICELLAVLTFAGSPGIVNYTAGPAVLVNPKLVVCCSARPACPRPRS